MPAHPLGSLLQDILLVPVEPPSLSRPQGPDGESKVISRF
jgi:hypothetical protein